MLGQWLRDHGPWCPGDGVRHGPHVSWDLTLDHVVPLEAGGAPFDVANVRVLCRGWNSVRRYAEGGDRDRSS